MSVVLEKLKRPLWDGPPFPEKPLSAYNLFVKEKFASIEPDADITGLCYSDAIGSLHYAITAPNVCQH